jgi:serine/threonine protein kinase
MPDIEIGRAALGRLDELSKTGAFGIVYTAPELTLPDVAGPLVVKLFLADSQPASEVERLRRIVTWRVALTPARRRELDSLSAWPVRIVVEGRKVVGIVMPRAPERFFFDNIQQARGRSVKRTAVTIQSLIQDAAKTRGRGIPTPDDDDLVSRLICCARLAQFLRLLHSQGLVYGDLSHGNVLVSAEPAPAAVLFIDCDVAYPMESKHPNRQHGTVLWFSPEESTGALLDERTDIYKLCLAILRILVNGGNVSQMTSS